VLQLITSVADGDGDFDLGVMVGGEYLGINDSGHIAAATSATAVVAERALGEIALEVIVAIAAALVSVDLRSAAIEAAELTLRGELVAQEKVGRAFNPVAAQISVAASATISGMALVVTTILAWPVFSPSPYPKGKDQAHILSRPPARPIKIQSSQKNIPLVYPAGRIRGHPV
jgi:hypothetical protein